MRQIGKGMIESAEEFVRLRTSEDQRLYSRAATEPASEEVWLEVIEKYPDMREWVAHNKTVPISILERLAEDPDRRVRVSVALKRKLSLELFDKLSKDPDDDVRQRIVCNAKAPLEILRRLVDDPSELVARDAREKIAERERCVRRPSRKCSLSGMIGGRTVRHP